MVDSRMPRSRRRSAARRSGPGRARPGIARVVGAAALAVGVVASGRMGLEAAQEARGERPRTWAATRVLPTASPRGRLARRLAEPTGPPPPPGPARRRALAWAGPTTAVGLLVAAVSGGRWRWDDGACALVVSGARNPLLRLGGVAAQGIGHVVVSRRDPVSPALLAHELAHVRQAELLGPATLPLYVWWLARHGYRDHPMERGARATARRETGGAPGGAGGA